ncbi:MAG: hypothetical protein U1E87_02230 [Alphaproteobacteria bacterium]
MDTLFQAGDVAGFVTLAGIVASLPMHGNRGNIKSPGEETGRRGRYEKEFGPPSFEDFMMMWEGLSRVRINEYYGLSFRPGAAQRGHYNGRELVTRVAALCARAKWGSELERKLVLVAQRRDARAAESFYPRRSFWSLFSPKSRITDVECRKVVEYFKKTGLIQYGMPVFEHAAHKDMLARALSARVGKPNDAIVGHDQRLVYEFFSLDVQQVLTEQGRYYLMKGCAEITTDSKLGLAHVRIFQRWGESPKQRGQDGASIVSMDEEYEGNLFMQDDIVYALLFKTDRSGHGRHAENEAKSRKNMVALVLSGFSRDADGFHKKMTGGQLGQGIGGTVGVLSAPCVFYRVGSDRLQKLQDEMKQKSPQHWTRVAEGKSKDSLNYEILKWDSAFIDLLNGVDQRYAPVMADLDVPMPLPASEEEGGPEIVIGGRH